MGFDLYQKDRERENALSDAKYEIDMLKKRIKFLYKEKPYKIALESLGLGIEFGQKLSKRPPYQEIPDGIPEIDIIKRYINEEMK